MAALFLGSPPYLDYLGDEVVKPLPAGTDELWVKVVSPYPLPWQFQVTVRILLLQFLIELVEFVVPEDTAGVKDIAESSHSALAHRLNTK